MNIIKYKSAKIIYLPRAGYYQAYLNGDILRDNALAGIKRQITIEVNRFTA